MTSTNGRRTARPTAVLLAAASTAALAVGLLAVAGQASPVTIDPVTRLAGTAGVTPVEPSLAPAPGPGATAPAGIPRPGAAWVDRMARRTGIGATALSAYASAHLRLAVEKPRCLLSWATLAGVGYVESRHGTIGGRTLDRDGRPGLTPIVGVALTGAGAVAHIGDTDGGRIDGDATYDRAVGPMQFVPGTWRTWGSDGDGDGAAEPQDLDDAAYSAGRYLCAAGVPLDSGTAWTGAVLSYNPSTTYLRDVLAAANAYASRSTG